MSHLKNLRFESNRPPLRHLHELHLADFALVDRHHGHLQRIFHHREIPRRDGVPLERRTEQKSISSGVPERTRIGRGLISASIPPSPQQFVLRLRLSAAFGRAVLLRCLTCGVWGRAPDPNFESLRPNGSTPEQAPPKPPPHRASKTAVPFWLAASVSLPIGYPRDRGVHHDRGDALGFHPPEWWRRGAPRTDRQVYGVSHKATPPPSPPSPLRDLTVPVRGFLDRPSRRLFSNKRLHTPHSKQPGRSPSSQQIGHSSAPARGTNTESRAGAICSVVTVVRDATAQATPSESSELGRCPRPRTSDGGAYSQRNGCRHQKHSSRQPANVSTAHRSRVRLPQRRHFRIGISL